MLGLELLLAFGAVLILRLVVRAGLGTGAGRAVELECVELLSSGMAVMSRAEGGRVLVLRVIPPPPAAALGDPSTDCLRKSVVALAVAPGAMADAMGVPEAVTSGFFALLVLLEAICRPGKCWTKSFCCSTMRDMFTTEFLLQ